MVSRDRDLVLQQDEVISMQSVRSSEFSARRVLADATRGLVLVAAAAAPWFFGGVKAPIQSLLCALVGMVLLGCGLVQRFGKKTPLPTIVIPLMFAICIGIFQLIPFGTETLNWLSPRGAALWQELDEWAVVGAERSAAASGDTRLETRTISLYPASTGHDLVLLVFLVGACVAASQLFCVPRAAMWLCGAVAVNGAALAFFGMVQQLSWNGQLYWQVPLTRGGSPFASFVNRNNAGGYLNLCLAGGLALTIWVFSRTTSPRRSVRRGPWWIGWLADLDAPRVGCLVMLILTATGIVLTLSRGAWCAAAAALLVTALAAGIARAAKPSPGWLLPIVGGIALILWLGRGEMVQSRFQSFLNQSNFSAGRLTHWPTGLAAAKDFARSGSGLGTYRFIYRPYQTDVQDLLFFHAENQYLEALVEAGVAGLACLLVCIGLMGYACWRNLRAGADPAAFAIGIGGCYALLTQAIHGFFDFGLYLPANALLMALFCGAVVGCAASSSVWRGGSRGWLRHRLLALPTISGVSALTIIGLAAGAAYGHVECKRLAMVERVLDETRFPDRPLEDEADQLATQVARLTAACLGRPHDAEGLLRLAELRVRMFRTAALEELEEHFSETPAAPPVATRWAYTAPLQLHAKAQLLSRSGQFDELDRWRSQPLIGDHLPLAIHHLFLARRACPLLPRVHLQLAELEAIVADVRPRTAIPHLQRAELLYPTDAGLLLQIGLLHLHAGRTSEALGFWRRCAELKPSRIGALVTLVRVSNLLEHLAEVLPPSAETLVRVAQQDFASPQDREVQASLLVAAEKLLQQPTEKDQANYWMGTIRSLQGRRTEAIEYLEQAVHLRPAAADWRYALAQLLKHEGAVDRAYKHAQECVRAEPANAEFERLFRELIRLRLVRNDQPPGSS